MGVIGVRIAFVIFGVAFFAPFHAWAQQLIPPTCRYAVISLGYALGTQALGSPTAALALWCFQKTGTGIECCMVLDVLSHCQQSDYCNDMAIKKQISSFRGARS